MVSVDGVRDKLRVLLVSGEPHAGERIWRNLLKADPSVDLVHFTILRPPEKQDGTPINELVADRIPDARAVPEKLSEFDLVIFDRYAQQGVLPIVYFDNIAQYVRDGGALLLAAGPEFADDTSIYRTPLAAVLPAEPSGDVTEQSFRARAYRCRPAPPGRRLAGWTARKPIRASGAMGSPVDTKPHHRRRRRAGIRRWSTSSWTRWLPSTWRCSPPASTTGAVEDVGHPVRPAPLLERVEVEADHVGLGDQRRVHAAPPAQRRGAGVEVVRQRQEREAGGRRAEAPGSAARGDVRAVRLVVVEPADQARARSRCARRRHPPE